MSREKTTHTLTQIKQESGFPIVFPAGVKVRALTRSSGQLVDTYDITQPHSGVSYVSYGYDTSLGLLKFEEKAYSRGLDFWVISVEELAQLGMISSGGYSGSPGSISSDDLSLLLI